MVLYRSHNFSERKIRKTAHLKAIESSKPRDLNLSFFLRNLASESSLVAVECGFMMFHVSDDAV